MCSSHSSQTNGTKIKEIIETFLICASVVTIVIVLWTYHPTEAPRPPATCATDTSGTVPHMPARMLAKENHR